MAVSAAAEAGKSAGLSAADNVEVNLPYIEDPERRAALANRAAASLAALERAVAAARGEPLDLDQSNEEILKRTEAMCRSRPRFMSREAWMKDIQSKLDAR